MAYIITLITFVLAGVFALLVKVWAGFAYFVLALLMLLSIFWAVWQIVKYFTTFKKQLAENFKIFRAETINKNNISSANFEENIAVYKKEFNRQMLKDKLYYWGLIIFSFGLAILFLTAIILL